ncbi:head-tail connector protein [Brevundimonas naejangsanensis]|uniref:head-tail connector protein n=1 Tax=Brevundimonas naejangsanensis TaxID=588932 RepID=UPI00106B17D0|nr:head-tail connector protein [Brevundimonas naejangsanensis]QBQ49087.1 phage gp6-like head-tail connector protein [Brevundimonas naejangsanensis]
MMTVVDGLFSLEDAKQHLRVDHGDDDGLIEIYADAAVSAALGYAARPEVPADLRAVAAFRSAALLMLGDLYATRETERDTGSIAAIAVPMSARFLLNPWRLLSV